MFRSIAAVIALSVVACSAEVGSPQPTDPGAPRVETTSANDPAPGHMPKRGAVLFDTALSEPIGLTAEQRTTIEGLVAQLPEMPPMGAAIATAIRSGETDQAKLEAVMTAAQREGAMPLARLLGQLHQTLTKEQRSKVVAALLAKPPKRFEARMAHEDKVTKGEHQVAPQEIRVQILAEYRLKVEQFAEDNFDAASFATPTVHVEGLFAKLATMTPEQREKLAQKLASPIKHEKNEIREIRN